MRTELICYMNYNFLGETDNLNKIIQKDADYLKSIKITCKSIGENLDDMYDYYWKLLKNIEKEEKTIKCGLITIENAKYVNRRKGDINMFTYEDVLYNIIKINNKINIASTYYKGIQYCPFRNDKFDNSNTEFNAVELVILVSMEGKYHEIILGALSIHLIKKHSFFGGNGANRIEPQLIIRVLESFNNDNKLEI